MRFLLIAAYIAASIGCAHVPSSDAATARTGWIGIRHTSADSSAMVLRVWPDSPAALAGMQPGDRIFDVNGCPVASATQLDRCLAAIGAGETIAIKIRRDGWVLRTEVTATTHDRAYANSQFFDPGLLAFNHPETDA